MDKKIVAAILCMFFLVNIPIISPLSQPTIVSDESNMISSQISRSNESLIDEFTWSFLRYECNAPTKYYGFAKMPKPSVGSLLVPSNMMLEELCEVAVSVYSTDKMEVLTSLASYDMVMNIPFYADHPLLTMLSFLGSLPVYAMRKSSADEMMQWDDSSLSRSGIVGDCYAQAAFNTAVLRLCGFSAEEVFLVLIPQHAICVAQVDDQWYVFDSVKARNTGQTIYENYPVPASRRCIERIENDNYFVNFVPDHTTLCPYLADPYSNMDAEQFSTVADSLMLLFQNATLGALNWSISGFLANATECPEIKPTQSPFSVADAIGSSSTEKAEWLATATKQFVRNQTEDEQLNQFHRSLYSLGFLEVDYPQAYANAAKYAYYTSWFARLFDARAADNDISRTLNWVNFFIKNEKNTPQDRVFFSDFVFRLRSGSSIDKAVSAYGMLRNMKKDTDFWPVDDLFVIITMDDLGFLAVNIDQHWQYLCFEQGKTNPISDEPPEDIHMVFNERDYVTSWEE